jgi:hypothetical protein
MTAPKAPHRLADLRALSRLLEAQPQTLAEMRPERVERLARHLHALCDRIDTAHGPASAAEAALAARVGRTARRVLRQLAAAQAGLRDAAAVLTGARSAAETRTYGPQGQARVLDAPAGRLEQRR